MGAGVGAGVETWAAPAAPIEASFVPTATVESTGTSIDSKTPATGDGISVSTLSVETSNNGSSTATVSPTFFSHLVTVPSVTDSPRAGITTGVESVLTFVAAAGATGAGVATGAAATGVSTTGALTGSGVCTGAGAVAVAVALTESAMIANSAPTGATLSTGTTIFWRIPAAGDGISVSTLSVETSSSGSSRAT